MKRADYDQLERDIIATWRSVDPKGDPVTSGQIRAAEVTGKLIAFLQRELDALGDNDDPEIVFDILAAITANAVYGLTQQFTSANGDDDVAKKTGVLMFLRSVMLYLGDKSGMFPDVGLTKSGPAVKVHKTDLGDA